MPAQAMKRTLIINADDFGYTGGVNSAIARCSREGVLTSATLMANGAAFDGAVALARENPALGIGVHLTLTELAPVSSPGDIPGLTDEKGLLLPSPGDLLYALASGGLKRESIRKELERQVVKILDCGIVPTHLDSHKHVFALPPVLDAALEVAAACSIRWIRNPFDRCRLRDFLPCVGKGARGVFLKQYAKSRMLTAFRPYFLRRVRESGLRTPDHFFGVSLTGLWNEAAAIEMLESLPPGISEWMVHPGDCDEELRKRKTRLIEERERERDLLTSSPLKEKLAKSDIAVRHFGEETA